MTTEAEAADMVDPAGIRTFVTALHAAAARALNGARDPGMLQLGIQHPRGGSFQAMRFAIGDVDLMTEAAIRHAEGGFNVYVEGRTVDPRASGRGEASATRGVFAFVDDADHDKGKGGNVALAPSWVVESSPGNAHRWFLLDKAITADEAEPLGRAMRAWFGSDSATGTLTQPYRVAGTPNYPDSKKRARGRVTVPTRILSLAGPLWSAAALSELVPPAPERLAGHVPKGCSGVTSSNVEELAADTGDDRSGRFHETVRAAHRAGMFPADLDVVLRKHPSGCAAKYLEPTDRLAEEIVRSWGKVAAEAEKEAEAIAVALEAGLAPTYPSHAVPVEDARAAVREALRSHLAAGAGCRAIRASTGLGKTRTAAELLIEDIKRKRGGERRPWLVAVPTHALGGEVEELFKAAGVSAQVFRGRLADDPDMPGTGQKMCRDPEIVDLAVKLGLPVSTSCCRGKHSSSKMEVTCPFFNECAYQRQLRSTPEAWVASHELLFQAPSNIDEVAGVLIDEGFWRAGIKLGGKPLTIDTLEAAPPVGRNIAEEMVLADIRAWRSTLAAALRAQEELGGVARRTLVEGGIDYDFCTRANRAEWKLKERVVMWPAMSEKARKAAIEAAKGAVSAQVLSSVWTAACELLQSDDEDAVSGHLILDEVETKDGSGKAKAIKVRGLRQVLDRFADVPTFIMDAMLPDPEILEKFYPDVEITADIEALTPHATVRQVLGAPTSAGKLMRSEAGRNREAVRRAILHRFVELGRPKTLVICQFDLEPWLQDKGLPAGIEVAHFNAIAGLDRFKDISLLIVIGRTLMTVFDAEAMSGAVTGFQGEKTDQPDKGPRWYKRTPLAIRMKDGTGYPVDGDRHPDALTEAVRWQIAEAEVMQAIGRARAVNRTAENPVRIEVWNNLVLPLTVDEVVRWDDIASGREADMKASGVVLTSAPDMAKAWPKIWDTEQAAKRWLQERGGAQTLIENIPRSDTNLAGWVSGKGEAGMIRPLSPTFECGSSPGFAWR